jgi:hypothetical protein
MASAGRGMTGAPETLHSLNVATPGRNYPEETEMRRSVDELVRSVVARHLQVAPATIAARMHLVRELDLDPLDLVLMAIRIEALEGVEFPIARLEGISDEGSEDEARRRVRVHPRGPAIEARRRGVRRSSPDHAHAQR